MRNERFCNSLRQRTRFWARKRGKSSKRQWNSERVKALPGGSPKTNRPLTSQMRKRTTGFPGKADVKTGFITRNLLCAPLLYGDDLIGVINVLNSKEKPCFDGFDESLLECFADLAGTAITRSRFLELRLQQERMEVQLEAAAKIQALFWPKLPDLGVGSNVWAMSTPATFVGGDLYDVIRMDDESWLIYVADVSDKGLPAALIMAALSTKIRSEALSRHEVDKLLENVNKGIYELT